MRSARLQATYISSAATANEIANPCYVARLIWIYGDELYRNDIALAVAYGPFLLNLTLRGVVSANKQNNVYSLIHEYKWAFLIHPN